MTLDDASLVGFGGGGTPKAKAGRAPRVKKTVARMSAAGGGGGAGPLKAVGGRTKAIAVAPKKAPLRSNRFEKRSVGHATGPLTVNKRKSVIQQNEQQARILKRIERAYNAAYKAGKSGRARAAQLAKRSAKFGRNLR